MGLHELTLRNFRLFDHLVFTPDPDAITVLLSANGTGKTSVLEAVVALATASSFRTNAASDMIRNKEPMAEVHGVVFQQQRRMQVDLTLARGVRNTTKRMLVNGQRPKSRSALSEFLPLTIFTPEGVDVIRQGPEHRRHYLTTLLTDVDLSTGDIIERFTHVLQQRNALLRSFQGESPTSTLREELETWNSEFVNASEKLLDVRLTLVQSLEPLVAHYYQSLARNDVHVGVTYEQSWDGDLDQALRDSFRDDVYRGYSTIGPQRDDVQLTLDNRDSRRQASQGEQRSLALAVRLAGHELIRRERGLDPLLLLDDVFSELDPVRSTQLLQLLPVGQTLVTTASPFPNEMAPAAIIDLTKSAT